MRSVFLLIFLFTVAFCGMAESRVTDRLGIRDGLSNNFVTDIAQDGYGFLWIATDNGLNRFDGERFIVFDEKDKSLKGNSIDAIYYDDVAGYIWVGTKKGVNIIDCRTLRNVDLQIPAEIAGYGVADFTPDGEGGIYLLGKYGFIAHFDRKQACWHIFREADFKGLVMSMFSAATTPDGLLAAGQENYGLSLIDIKKQTFENHMHNPGQTGSLPGNNVRSLLVSRDGNLYVGTEHGAARFDSTSRTFAPVELSDVRGRSTGNGNITSLTERYSPLPARWCFRILSATYGSEPTVKGWNSFPPLLPCLKKQAQARDMSDRALWIRPVSPPQSSQWSATRRRVLPPWRGKEANSL